MSSNLPHQPLTQEEVDRWRENMHDASLAVEKHHFERLKRIEAIAIALAGSDDEDIDWIERALGLHPYAPRKLRWWEQWWGLSPILLTLSAIAATGDLVLGAVGLVTSIIALLMLYSIQKSRHAKGWVK